MARQEIALTGARHVARTAHSGRSAAPFPKLPDEWPRANLVIGIGFNFSMDRG